MSTPSARDGAIPDEGGVAGWFAGARTDSEVWAVAAELGTRYLGTAHSVVLRRTADDDGAGGWLFAPVFRTPGLRQLAPFQSVASLAGMGLVVAPPPGQGGAYRPLFGGIPDAAGGGVVYAALGESCVLVLVYRRGCPVLSLRSWALLAHLRAGAAVALAAIRPVPARIAHRAEPPTRSFKPGKTPCSSDA